MHTQEKIHNCHDEEGMAVAPQEHDEIELSLLLRSASQFFKLLSRILNQLEEDCYREESIAELEDRVRKLKKQR